jgi:thioredoxin reductase (NADPH)
MLIRGADLGQTVSQYLIDQIAMAVNVSVETQTQVTSVSGANCLETICTRRSGEGVKQRDADTLFVMIGANALTHWLPAQLQRKDGYICTGNDVSDLSSWGRDRAPYLLETNLPGFFCVGDVRHNSIKRVSSSVGEGSMAVAFIHQYLRSDATNCLRP